MKMNPQKNYRKPLYAIGAAALIAATSLTGCGGDKKSASRRSGPTWPTQATEPILDGDVVIMGEADIYDDDDYEPLPEPEQKDYQDIEDNLEIEGGVALYDAE